MTQSSILTSQIGSGPVRTLDLSALPEAMTRRILLAAIQAVHHVDNCDVEVAQDGDKETAAALDELSFAVHALDQLEHPTVPGAELFAGELQGRYPVIRDGTVAMIPLENMSQAEVEATIKRLRWQAAGELRHAEMLQGAHGSTGQPEAS